MIMMVTVMLMLMPMPVPVFNEDDEGLYHQHQTLCTSPSFVCLRCSLRILREHTDLAETKRKPVMSEP